MFGKYVLLQEKKTKLLEMIKKPPVVLEEKFRIARNLKTISLFDQLSLFFSHVRNFSQKNVVNDRPEWQKLWMERNLSGTQ